MAIQIDVYTDEMICNYFPNRANPANTYQDACLSPRKAQYLKFLSCQINLRVHKESIIKCKVGEQMLLFFKLTLVIYKDGSRQIYWFVDMTVLNSMFYYVPLANLQNHIGGLNISDQQTAVRKSSEKGRHTPSC